MMADTRKVPFISYLKIFWLLPTLVLDFKQLSLNLVAESVKVHQRILVFGHKGLEGRGVVCKGLQGAAAPHALLPGGQVHVHKLVILSLTPGEAGLDPGSQIHHVL